jgi:hypothetical protein
VILPFLGRCQVTASYSVILLILFSAFAAAQTPTANLAGTVRDDSGNPLPGSTVLAKNPETGFERQDVTDERGAYRLPSLPFGTYDVSAEIQTFASQVQKGVPLDVGRTVTLDFILKLISSGQTVEASGGPPLIERTESQIATLVTPEQIEKLPLNDRQFANLAVLAPGTALVSNPDPTRLRNLAVSSIGGSGRNLNITIDGGDNTDDTIGGINEFYPLESIAEFNFLRIGYKAEYGRASGGVLNVVTRSGTNDFHGSFFSFFRDDALNALSRPEKDAGLNDPPDYGRKQFGGSIGGPIAKNRAHFFIAIEREQLDIPIIVNTFGVAPEFDGVHNIPTRNNLYTAKGTVNIDPKQFLTVRYGQQNSTTVYGVYPGYAPNSWASLKNTFHSILASHNYLIGDDKLNELLFQFADFQNQITPDSFDPVEFFRATYVTLGQVNAPQQNQQKKYQIKDDYSWSSSFWKGSHHWKAGLQLIHEPVVGGAISHDETPYSYIYDGTDRDASIVEIDKQGGQFQFNVPNNQYGIYFQDDWNFNERLTLNLGVRYDYVTGFDLDQSGNTLYEALSQLPYDFPWLDSVKKNPSGMISNDANNIAPRLGFAYDWNGNGRLVLRGGFGIFYDFPFTNGNILFAQTAGKFGPAYSHFDEDGIRNTDGSPFRIGDPLPPNDLSGIFQPRDAVSPDFVVSFTRQISLGFSKLIGDLSALDVDYIYAAGRDRYVRFLINGTVDGERILPDFGRFRPLFWYNGAFSDYNALNVTFRHQLSRRYQLQAAYTLSKVTGDTLFGSDEFRLGGRPFFPCGDNCSLDFTIGPGDDPRMVGPLNTDALHRIVIAASADLPYQFRFSGLFRANSATPYNAFLPEDPGNGIPYNITDAHVNSRRGKGFSQLDVRIGKTFDFTHLTVEALLDIYNLLNAENPNSFVGNLELDSFGQPQAFGDPRQAQLGFRIEF